MMPNPETNEDKH